MIQVHGPRLHKPDLSKLQEQLTCLHVYMKSNIKVGLVIIVEIEAVIITIMMIIITESMAIIIIIIINIMKVLMVMIIMSDRGASAAKVSHKKRICKTIF